MHFSYSIKRVLQIVLTVLFLAHLGFNTLFIHTHYYEGQKVVHSHPYASGESHQHSQQALAWSLIHTFLLGLIISIFMLRPLSVTAVRQGIVGVRGLLSVSSDHDPVRGPPVF